MKSFKKLSVTNKIAVLSLLVAVGGLITSTFLPSTAQQLTSGNKSPIIKSDGNVTINYSEKTAGKESISFEYARFFGAYSPHLLHVNSGSCMFHTTQLFGLTDVEKEYWNNWKYKDSLPIESSAWHEINGCNRKLNRYKLLTLACPNNKNILAWSLAMSPQNISNTRQGIIKKLKIERESELASYLGGERGLTKLYKMALGFKNNNNLEKEIEECSRKVGFLVLYIKNVTDENLYNIQITYKENQVNQKVIPILERNESLMWVLSIYLSDSNGFPVSLLSKKTEPIEVSYRIGANNSVYRHSIRKPLREKAMKKYIPYGWLGQ